MSVRAPMPVLRHLRLLYALTLLPRGMGPRPLSRGGAIVMALRIKRGFSLGKSFVRKTRLSRVHVVGRPSKGGTISWLCKQRFHVYLELLSKIIISET